jgi:hypothetical protein
LAAQARFPYPAFLEHPSVKAHRFDNENYFVFETRQERDQWMVQFIWGKKDFRIHLRPGAAGASDDHRFPAVQSPSGEPIQVVALQYLNNYEWYDFDAVTGHGLSHEEVRWSRGKAKRYVELPKDFLETAVAIACREFGLERKAS